MVTLINTIRLTQTQTTKVVFFMLAAETRQRIHSPATRNACSISAEAI